MRPGAKADGGAAILGDVECVGAGKHRFVAVARAEHQEHAIFGLKRDAAGFVAPGDAAGRHADGGYPAGIFLEYPGPRGGAALDQRQLVGVGEQRPGRPGNGVARFVLSARDRQLHIGADRGFGQPGLHHHRQQRKIGGGGQFWQARGDVGIDRGGAIVAAGRDRRIAGVIGAAVDHALADPVHFGPGHIGQPGQGPERLARGRAGDIGHQIGVALRRDAVEYGGHGGLELCLPDIAHGFGRHGGKDRAAFGHMRRAVLAHQVLAHQHGHQPGGLIRGKHRDVLFMDENVVAPGDQRGVKLGDMGNRCLFAHPFEIGVGIGAKGGQVNFVNRGVRHGGLLLPAVFHRVAGWGKGGQPPAALRAAPPGVFPAK